jgi:urease accessory protein
MRMLRRLPIALATVLMPLVAQAHPGHPGHDFEWDFSAGFAHPLSGLDHLLAMVAVGLWAAQLGGRARWLVPSAFVTMMTLGAVLARAGLMLPATEPLIAASVLVLGLLIGTAARFPAAAGMALVGLFALSHGFAHGTEMPASAGALQYGAGFIFATILLHSAGLGLGLLAARRAPTSVTRYAGWGLAACGVLLLAGL